jgi:hypothetical protein
MICKSAIPDSNGFALPNILPALRAIPGLVTRETSLPHEQRPAVALRDSRLCFNLCGNGAMLHSPSPDGTRKDENISTSGAHGEAESLACEERRSGLDRLSGQSGRRSLSKVW